MSTEAVPLVGRRPARPLAWIAGVLVLISMSALPLAGPYALGLATEVLIFAIFAMSLNLLVGFTGLFSFGHAAFFGIGAYTVVILDAQFGISPWIGLIGGVSLAVVAAAVIGRLSVRVGGIAFLLLTMAFAQLVYSVSLRWRDVTGGSDGLSAVQSPGILNFSLADRVVNYYFTLAIFVACFTALHRILTSQLGHSFLGVRENEPRMRAIGFDVERVKLQSFVIAGAFAGLAGGLYAFYNAFVSSDALHWSLSGDALIMVILGGVGTLAGPVVGAALFLLAKNFISSYSDYWMLAIGVIFVACVMFFRDGIYGTLRNKLVGRGTSGE